MGKSARYLEFTSTRIVLGAAMLLATLPGSLFSDDTKKPAPAPPKAAAAGPAKAAAAAPVKGLPTKGLPGAVGGGHPAATAPVHPGNTPSGVTPRPGTGAGNAGSRGPGTSTGGRPGAGTPAVRPGGRPEVGRAPVNGHMAGHVGRVEQHGEHNVYRGVGGRARYERRLPDGRRIFADGRGRGHIEREYMYGGRRMYQRTYYVNGVGYPRYYNPYMYGGVELAVYAPPSYYAPAFYGYAYAPWGVPVVYNFGFAAAPWYGYYGGYFTPYPVYASPSLWLTDYMVAKSLEESYQAQQAQAQQMQQAPPAAALTPDVKAQIAEEVRRQIALENSEVAQAQAGVPDPASSGIARMLSDNTSHVFVVASDLTLTSAVGQCYVTEGDVLQLTPQAAGGEFANLVVMASKGQDCQKGNTVSVGVADLQDMQNHMRQTIDQGLGQLQASQGKAGLPPLPPSAAGQPVDSAYAKVAPPPDPNGAQQVSQEWDAGSKAEQAPVNDVVAGGPGSVGAPAAPGAQPAPAAAQADPGSIAMGQSLAEVEAIMGKPSFIAKPAVGKVLYVYKDLNVKVTFTNGKVSNIE